MFGEHQKVPQSPSEAVAEDEAWVEKGLQHMDEYLARWAEFRLYEQQREEQERG